MADESRLEWVAKNRRRESNVRPIGSRSAGLVERLEQMAQPVEEAVGVVAGVVDGEFRELCRVEGIEAGVLRIGVAEVAATSGLRRRWAGVLMEALPARLKIKRIAFAYGTRGYRLD